MIRLYFISICLYTIAKSFLFVAKKLIEWKFLWVLWLGFYVFIAFYLDTNVNWKCGIVSNIKLANNAQLTKWNNTIKSVAYFEDYMVASTFKAYFKVKIYVLWKFEMFVSFPTFLAFMYRIFPYHKLGRTPCGKKTSELAGDGNGEGHVWSC